jgi:hypothetical protein
VKGQEHLDKAATFIERAASGESSGVVLANDGESAPLSGDASIATAQILAATGHPITLNEEGQTVAIDPLEVIADASPEQIEQLTVLGFFGATGSREDVDYTIRQRFYDQDPDGNEAPKPEYADGGTWAAYLAG